MPKNNYQYDYTFTGGPCDTCNARTYGVESDRCRVCAYFSFKKNAAPVIDLDRITWDGIKKAASESKWMPPEYMVNDWAADVCAFLTYGCRCVEPYQNSDSSPGSDS